MSETNVEQIADRLIISGKGIVTEEKGRLDFPHRLPICYGNGLNLNYCYGCIFYLFWAYRAASKIMGNDLAISCPVIKYRRKKVMKSPIPSNFYYCRIDYWGEERYKEFLPYIISLYGEEFWNTVLDYLEIKPK